MSPQDLELILRNQHAIMVALSRLGLTAADLEQQKEATRRRIAQLKGTE